MSVAFDSEIAAAPYGSRSSPRRAPPQPFPADVTTTEHDATADEGLAIGYRQPRPSPDGRCPDGRCPPEHKSRARPGGE